MKSRRHLTILLLLVASVFLCLVACGVPTYLIPDTAKITRISDDKTLMKFSVQYSAQSEDPSKDRVGLLLLYYLGDSTNSASSSINNKFLTTYRPTKYDGYSINLSDDSTVLSYTYSEIKYDIYALEMFGEHVNAPYYDLPIVNNPAYYTFELSYDDTARAISLSCAEAPSLNRVFTLYEDFPPLDTNTLHIYAAISVQSTNYSNIYWSDLQYAGPISLI